MNVNQGELETLVQSKIVLMSNDARDLHQLMVQRKTLIEESTAQSQKDILENNKKYKEKAELENRQKVKKTMAKEAKKQNETTEIIDNLISIAQESNDVPDYIWAIIRLLQNYAGIKFPGKRISSSQGELIQIFNFNSLGVLGNIRANTKLQADGQFQATNSSNYLTSRISALEQKQDLILTKVTIFGEKCILKIIFFLFLQLEELSYHVTVDQKVIDIDHYVPFQSTEAILAFCNPNDGLMKEKRLALKERLYASGDQTNMKTFVAGIVTAFFDGPLLGTHKWPYKK